MRNYFMLLVFLIGGLNATTAQELNDYKYVKVPQTFEFLKEANQYQLNALTAFLLEKEGFEVFYENDIPENLDFCQVLDVVVKEDSGLFSTRLTLSLKNCRNQVVFTSEEGTSREKQYKKAFHEALREAVASLEATDYAYSGKDLEDFSAQPEKVEEALAEKVVDNEKALAEQALPEVVNKEASMESLQLRNGSTSYTLNRKGAGFELFRNGEEEPMATLLKSGSGSNYIYASKNVQGSAYFDENGNLVVEYLDANSGQLISIHYSAE